MKNLIKKLDSYIYKRGGWLYRMWFVFDGSGQFDNDSGAEMGYVKHRIKFLDSLYEDNNKEIEGATAISISNLFDVDVGTYDGNTYSFNEFTDRAIEMMWEYLQEQKDPMLELPEVKESPSIIAEALTDYEDEALSNFENELILSVDNNVKPIIEPVLKKWGIRIGKFSYNRPREYNFRTDELDLQVKYELSDDKFEVMKEQLRPEIEKYIDDVRQKSYDGYMSLEPDSFDEVKADDYAYLWAILQREDVFNEIRELFEEDIFDTLSDWLTFELYGSYIAGLQKGVVETAYGRGDEPNKTIKLKLSNRKE